MNEEKVNVKLEKHLWPDEIQHRKRKRSMTFMVIFISIIAFVLGILTSSLLKSPQKDPIIFDRPINENTNEEVVIEPLTPDEQFEKFKYIYNVLSQNWYFSKAMPNASEEIMTNAIKGMIEKNGDIHTEYMTGEEMRLFEEGINQNYVGIGVQYYQVDGYSIVLKVFNSSPAEKADVQPGDIFWTVDGINVIDMDQDKVSEMVRGEEGTSVTIEFKRNDDIITKDIVRASITSTTFAKMLEPGIGYLEINSFGMSTAEEVKQELEMMRDQGATKLIIDVRDNGGGYLVALNRIASFFLDSNSVIIQQEDVTGNIVKTYSTNEKFDNFDEIVMLINQNSASASEVLALALRDNLNIDLVGTKTYGKGTVQTSLPLADGSALKYTIAEWISPSGQRIHGVGISPTVEVKIHEIFYTNTPILEDNQQLKADSVHEGVGFVQQALDFLGYDVDRVDGYYSEQTLKAYQEYLKDSGLDETDVIDQETIATLSSKVYQRYNQSMEQLDIQLEKAIELLK